MNISSQIGAQTSNTNLSQSQTQQAPAQGENQAGLLSSGEADSFVSSNSANEFVVGGEGDGGETQEARNYQNKNGTYGWRGGMATLLGWLGELLDGP